ncbi:MAG: DUF3228 family protein [Candidatus Krumholzibacteriota bacterium]|nr:DUF3228 family protein [Candidatus Krumholzibacteriota bacterium]
MTPSIGWSDFARERYRPGQGRSYFAGTEAELVALVRAQWDARRPGAGRADLAKVVVVDLPPERFVGATVRVDETTPLRARFTRRQPEEDGFVEVRARGPREPARYAMVVLYSAAALLENDGRRSGDCDWEIVSIQAGPLRDEPMRPLTMARNFLGKPGGTPCRYTAEQFAEAVWYWSARAGADEGD